MRTIVEVGPLLTRAHCEALVAAATARAAVIGWGAARHDEHATEDVKVGDLRDSGALDLFLTNVERPLKERIAAAYRLPLEGLEVDDAFIVRYSHTGQRLLEKHRDGSLVSATVSLSRGDDYEGGGTNIDGAVYRSEQGGAVLFPGARLHSGHPITQGSRFILTVFFKHQGHCGCDHVTEDEAPLFDGLGDFNKNQARALSGIFAAASLATSAYDMLHGAQ